MTLDTETERQLIVLPDFGQCQPPLMPYEILTWHAKTLLNGLER